MHQLLNICILNLAIVAIIFHQPFDQPFTTNQSSATIALPLRFAARAPRLPGVLLTAACMAMCVQPTVASHHLARLSFITHHHMDVSTNGWGYPQKMVGDYESIND